MNGSFRPLSRCLGLAALIVLSVGTLPCLATTWIKCARGADDTTWQYDADSVRTYEKLIFVWFKVTLAKPEYNPDFKANVAYVVLGQVLACSTRASANITSNFYNQEGQLLGSIPGSASKFQPLVPGSAISYAAEAVCGLGTHRDEAPGTKGTQPGAETGSTVGSGFVVTRTGLVVTALHVVNDCASILVTDSLKGIRHAHLEAFDGSADLALLKCDRGFNATALFREGTVPRAGEKVTVLGFPLAGLLADQVNVSEGIVSATAGLHNDPSMLQVSAPVEPGSSGGPLLDASGNVVGVVVAKLDALAIARAIGDVPQNINFAIKGELAQSFLRTHGVKFETAKFTTSRAADDLASQGRAFTVQVECVPATPAKETTKSVRRPLPGSKLSDGVPGTFVPTPAQGPGGVLTIEALGTGVPVRVDGKPVGSTPLSVEVGVGVHLIVGGNDVCGPESRVVQVEPNETSRVQLELDCPQRTPTPIMPPQQSSVALPSGKTRSTSTPTPNCSQAEFDITVSPTPGEGWIEVDVDGEPCIRESFPQAFRSSAFSCRMQAGAHPIEVLMRGGKGDVLGRTQYFLNLCRSPRWSLRVTELAGRNWIFSLEPGSAAP